MAIGILRIDKKKIVVVVVSSECKLLLLDVAVDGKRPVSDTTSLFNFAENEPRVETVTFTAENVVCSEVSEFCIVVTPFDMLKSPIKRTTCS